MSGTAESAGTGTGRGDEDDHGESELPRLMVRYQKGEPDAVEMLVQRLAPLLWRYFASTQISRGDTEDLLQDCWMRIHRSRHTYRPADPLLPWIFAIARYTRLDAYRKRRRRESRETLVATTPDVRVSSGASESDDLDRLNHLLGELPASQREVILMLKVSDLTLEEVARATSSTVGAIKQKAHRAYVRLRELLEKEGH